MKLTLPLADRSLQPLSLPFSEETISTPDPGPSILLFQPAEAGPIDGDVSKHPLRCPKLSPFVRN